MAGLHGARVGVALKRVGLLDDDIDYVVAPLVPTVAPEYREYVTKALDTLISVIHDDPAPIYAYRSVKYGPKQAV